MAGLHFGDTAAAGYDRTVGQMTQRIVPFLLRAAHLAPSQQVLDVATGTGLAAEAAATIVGPTGRVVAADISSAMIDKARERLGRFRTVTFAVEDGQSLTFADESFDAVLCNMGLMYFPDPARGISEFCRVVRPGGCIALTVFTRADRALVGGLVRAAIARRFPSKRPAAEQFFSLGNEQNLRRLLQSTACVDVTIATETMTFTFPSFESYFGGVEQGAGHIGQEYMALPEDLRHEVREEIRREVGDTGGTIMSQVEVMVASGRR
jgi:ubiquinone/menaquinone biosynthesis C-methylase UbiE